MTTDRMKKAVAFCNKWAYGEKERFSGNIDNFNEVSAFLGKCLESAKSHARAAAINQQIFLDRLYD